MKYIVSERRIWRELVQVKLSQFVILMTQISFPLGSFHCYRGYICPQQEARFEREQKLPKIVFGAEKAFWSEASIFGTNHAL